MAQCKTDKSAMPPLWESPDAVWPMMQMIVGDDSTVHRPFRHWCQAGIFDRLWAVLVEACDELHGVDWQWQAADTARGKDRMGGDLVGRNPTDRGKKG